MSVQIEALQQQIESLQREIQQLRADLAQYKAVASPVGWGDPEQERAEEAFYRNIEDNLL